MGQVCLEHGRRRRQHVDLNRREFFQVTGAGAVAATVAAGTVGQVFVPGQAQAQAGFFNAPGKIVEVTDPNATKGLWVLNKEVVEKMVDKALMSLTGQST